jgi:hypothetical protein
MSDADQAPGNTHSLSRRRALKSLGVAAGVDLLLGESPAETWSAWRAMDYLKDEMQKGNVWRLMARGAYYRGERA